MFHLNAPAFGDIKWDSRQASCFRHKSWTKCEGIEGGQKRFEIQVKWWQIKLNRPISNHQLTKRNKCQFHEIQCINFYQTPTSVDDCIHLDSFLILF